MSTPPASYMHSVGGAFRSGGDEVFGKSKRGVLAAATAELLLADNAFRPNHKAVTQGRLREPSEAHPCAVVLRVHGPTRHQLVQSCDGALPAVGELDMCTPPASCCMAKAEPSGLVRMKACGRPSTRLQRHGLCRCSQRAVRTLPWCCCCFESGRSLASRRRTHLCGNKRLTSQVPQDVWAR